MYTTISRLLGADRALGAADLLSLLLLLLAALLLVLLVVLLAGARRRLQALEAQVRDLSGKLVQIHDRVTFTSTRELPVGLPLLVAHKDGVRLRGTIDAHTQEHLVVQLEGGERSVHLHAPVSVLFHNRQGLFTFPSWVSGRSGRSLYLRHSAAVSRYQRRHHLRSRVELPVFVKRYQAEMEPLQSTLIDVSGGGASLHNPMGQFEAGQILELAFTPGHRELNITARVLRSSADGRILHTRFESLSDSERDHIEEQVAQQSGGR